MAGKSKLIVFVQMVREGPIHAHRASLAAGHALSLAACRDLLARHDVLEAELWRLHERLLEYEGGI